MYSTILDLTTFFMIAGYKEAFHKMNRQEFGVQIKFLSSKIQTEDYHNPC